MTAIQPNDNQAKDIQPNVQRRVLGNGMTLLVVENPTADIVSGRLFLKKAGGVWETPAQAGLFNLLATVLTKGTHRLSAVEIAEAVESRGAGLGADASSDYFALGLKTIASDFADIFGLLAEIMRSPSFPEAEVELEKRQIQQAIRSQQEQPFNLAFAQLREAMYLDHPYGRSILGTEQSVAKMGKSDLKQAHQDFFRPDHLVISLSGRITLDKAVQRVESVLGDWDIPPQKPTQPLFPALFHHPVTKLQAQETQQAIVMLGYLVPAIRSPDYPVLKLLNTYLGNGLSSRLFVELREKRGLAYDVSAFYPTRLDRSQFIVYMGTAPQNTQQAIAGLKAEVDRLTQTVLSEEEWQGAKNKLLGQYALGKQTNAELAHLYGWYETLELGIDYDQGFQDLIASITPEQALAVAQTYFLDPYISLVGPEDAINSGLSATKAIA